MLQGRSLTAKAEFEMGKPAGLETRDIEIRQLARPRPRSWYWAIQVTAPRMLSTEYRDVGYNVLGYPGYILSGALSAC